MANHAEDHRHQPILETSTAIVTAPEYGPSEFGVAQGLEANGGPSPASSRPTAPQVSFALLWESKAWMLATVGIILGVALPIIWLCVKPTYDAKALVRVSPKSLRMAFKNEDNSSVAFYKTFVNTQVSILRGPIVFQRVLDQEKVRQTNWYKAAPRSWFGPGATHLERLAASLSTKILRESELIEVSVAADLPADARLLVNAVIDEFKKFSDETLREVDTQRFETVVEEHGRLQKEIDGLLKTKFSVAKQLGTTNPEELRSQLTTHLSRLEEESGRVERALRMVQADKDWLAQTQAQEAEKGGDVVTNPQDVRKLHYARDGEWRRLNQVLHDARQGLELALQQLGESHPRVKEQGTRIDHAQQSLSEREAQLDIHEGIAGTEGATEGGNGSLDAVTLNRQADRLQKQLTLLRAETEQQRAKVASAGDLASDLAQYDEQIRRKRELGETLHARMTELELEGKAPARISIEAHATEPSRPERDRRILFSVMSLAAAVFCGLGVGYVRVALDPRIREAADVRQSVRVPFLGQLPALPTTERIMEGCTPFLLESVRIVRTALLERFERSGKGSVLITSTTSGTGKTSLAALLSSSLAALGKKTLLVEADLRRPSLAGRLGLQVEAGLAAVLNGTADDRKVARPTGIPRFDVVLAGPVPEDFDPELLANGVFETAMTRWRKTYDFIIVDSPPVLPVADARILARQAEGTLMVLRSSHTRRSDVIQAYADLSAAGSTLLGTVLVGVRAGAGGYGYDVGYHGYAARPRVLEAVS